VRILVYNVLRQLLCAENKGKTLHLLKQASKPVPQMRKRFKHNVYFEEDRPVLIKEESK